MYTAALFIISELGINHSVLLSERITVIHPNSGILFNTKMNYQAMKRHEGNFNT